MSQETPGQLGALALLREPLKLQHRGHFTLDPSEHHPLLRVSTTDLAVGLQAGQGG